MKSAARLVAGFLACSAIASTAAEFPERPVRLVVGYAPGGSIDTLARIVAQKLSDRWARGVVVENRPGADSVLAAEMVARAAPDGHTVLVASNAFATTASQTKLSYDPSTSFAPVVLMASVPNVLVIHASMVAVRTAADVVSLARAKPDALSFGSSGTSSPASMQMALLMQQTKTRMVEVSYKGAAPALLALVTGDTQLMFASIASAVPLIEARKLRALAISTRSRSPLLPHVPSVAEALRIPFDEAGTWVGLVAPAGVPADTVQRLRAEVEETLRQPTVQRTLAERGYVTIAQGPAPFGEFIRTEIAKSAQLLSPPNRRN